MLLSAVPARPLLGCELLEGESDSSLYPLHFESQCLVIAYALLKHITHAFLPYFDFPVEDSGSSLCSAPNTGPGAE